MKKILVGTSILVLSSCVSFPRPIVITQGAQTFNIGGAQSCPTRCNLTQEEKLLVLARRERIKQLKAEGQQKKVDRK